MGREHPAVAGRERQHQRRIVIYPVRHVRSSQWCYTERRALASRGPSGILHHRPALQKSRRIDTAIQIPCCGVNPVASWRLMAVAPKGQAKDIHTCALPSTTTSRHFAVRSILALSSWTSITPTCADTSSVAPSKASTYTGRMKRTR